MELFPAADDESWELIKRFIAGCDYYIVIVGGRYRSKGASRKSYTEMEYDYAVEVGLPVLAFLHGNPGNIVVDKAETTGEGKAALKTFRAKIEAARHAKYWISPKDLALSVFQSMSSLMKTKPRIGWVRADQVADESAAQAILRLRKRIAELEAHIAQSEVAAPAGTEGLAQGEETISLHFKYADFATKFVDRAVALSWNQILSVLGPILIIQSGEGDLKEKLVEVFRNKLEGSGVDVFYPSLSDVDFQTVKLQSRALGLIQELRDKVSDCTRSRPLDPDALWRSLDDAGSRYPIFSKSIVSAQCLRHAGQTK
jgi:hypothetical protein